MFAYGQPYIPFVHLNYILAVSCVSFVDYLGATAIGIIPGSCLYCYIGECGLYKYFDGCGLWAIPCLRSAPGLRSSHMRMVVCRPRHRSGTGVRNLAAYLDGTEVNTNTTYQSCLLDDDGGCPSTLNPFLLL